MTRLTILSSYLGDRNDRPLFLPANLLLAVFKTGKDEAQQMCCAHGNLHQFYLPNTAATPATRLMDGQPKGFESYCFAGGCRHIGCCANIRAASPQNKFAGCSDSITGIFKSEEANKEAKRRKKIVSKNTALILLCGGKNVSEKHIVAKPKYIGIQAYMLL